MRLVPIGGARGSDGFGGCLMESLTTSQVLSLAMTAIPAAIEPGQPEATRVRRVRWLIRLLSGLGVA